MTSSEKTATPAQKLRALSGGQPFMCWLNIPSEMSAEVAALAGYQLALVDLEHGPTSTETLLRQMLALQARGTSVIARTPETSPAWFKRILDLGPGGLMVPSVHSVEIAKQAVAEFKYAPEGRRGFAAGVIRAADYGVSADDWAARWNANGLLILQIESVAGLHAAPEIAALDGVDMLFFGPADYAVDLGPVAGAQSAVVEARERMRQIAHSAGKLAGTIVASPEDARALAEEGWDLIGLNPDIVTLRLGMERNLAIARGEGV